MSFPPKIINRDYISAGELRHWLEPGNVITQPYDFTNAVWNKTNSTVPGPLIRAPDGTSSATIHTRTSATGECHVRLSNPAAVSTPYTQMVWAKAGSTPWLKSRGLWLRNDTVNTAAWFNVRTGTVGTIQTFVTKTKMIPYNDGWWLCMIYGVSDSTINNNFLDIGQSGSDNSDNGTAGETLHLWGARLVIGDWI